MKKALALILSLMMVMSLCVVSVSAADEVVLDQDFESVTFATESGKNDWSTFMQSSIQDGGSYVDNGTSMRFVEYYNPTYYVYRAYKSEAKDDAVLRLARPYGDNASTASSTVYLPFTKAVSDGVLTIELDIAPVANYYYRAGIGLRDTTRPVTEYNLWSSWADATMLAGFTAWGYGYTNTVVGQRNVRSALPCQGLLGKAEGNNGHTQWITDDAMKAREDYVYGSANGTTNVWMGSVAQHSGITTQADGVLNFSTANHSGQHRNWRKWTITMDLDNNTFTFVEIGTLSDGTPVSYSKELDYIPGGEAGTYDALAVNLLVASNESTISSANNDGIEILVDNVIVTHTTAGGSAPSITENSQPVIKVDGEELADLSDIGPGSVLTASADYVADANGGRLIIAAYTDGELTGIKEATATETGTITVTADNNNEGFVGADTVRAFLFSNSTAGFKPLAASKTVSQ